MIPAPTPTRPAPVAHDDPSVQAAMTIVDGLKPAEQREIIRSAYRAAVAAHRTGEPGHMTEFANNLVATIRLRGIPEYAEALEASRLRAEQLRGTT